MAEARAMAAAGERVGVLFGPERAGLETADIVRANAVVSVPVNPAFGSLNLAQCVLLMAYEWQRSAGAATAADYRLAGARRATGLEVDRFVGHLVERLDGGRVLLPRAQAAEHDRPTSTTSSAARRSPTPTSAPCTASSAP